MAHIQLPCGLITVFDDVDLPLLSGFRWRSLQRRDFPDRFYVHAWHGAQHIYMHRLILGAPKGKHVDHRDGDGLNNRRANIRLATPSQNHANRGPDRRRSGKSSRFKGVYWVKRDGNWGATIHVNGKTRALGQYPTEELAAAAYDRAARAAWGEFARTNGSA